MGSRLFVCKHKRGNSEKGSNYRFQCADPCLLVIGPYLAADRIVT
jgi:hypothetical protein